MHFRPCGCAYTTSGPTGWWSYPCTKHAAAYKKRAASYRDPLPPAVVESGPTRDELAEKIARLEAQVWSLQEEIKAIKETPAVAFKMRKITGIRLLSKETWPSRAQVDELVRTNRSFANHEVVALIIKPE